ncbi:TPA: LOW QUALITY PROTEIN: hypothetical protein N0F65_010383 [Lagenidium giganteum]|uniref:Chromo domain-containing protein n=1 Tax=Lagenidium giganteum TaxID=4803 RepID=A0AAV2YN87_9STRA|nr:TPA: LOW QUALITY PROTEIN: hypothetical protein N0F65_010383 [Lagenidium giganteum]
MLERQDQTQAAQQRLLEQLMESRATSGLKLEGSHMPKYRGTARESFVLYRDQVAQYFEARNWYVIKRSEITSVEEFFTMLEVEFVPLDLQSRLPPKLEGRDGRGMLEYVERFRHIMAQITDMSELDKITYFFRGLQPRVKEEVQYKRPYDLSNAMTIAMDYDRSHGRSAFDSHQPYRPREAPSDEPEPMDIGNVEPLSRDKCLRRGLCFKCKKRVYRFSNCSTRRKSAPAGSSSNVKIMDPPIFFADFTEDAPHGSSKHVRIVESESPDPPVVFDEFTVNAVKHDLAEHGLIRKVGTINGHRRGFSQYDRPNVASSVLKNKAICLERFDGSVTKSQPVNVVKDTVVVNGHVFPDMEFTEWQLSPSQDPIVNWRTHELKYPSDTEQGTWGITDLSVDEFAKNFAVQRQKRVELTRKNLVAAQERQKKYYDAKRRDAELKEGDLVLLDTKNLSLKHAAQHSELKRAKLAARRIGPFLIEKMINDNVARLKLPATMKKVHPSFNIELLTKHVPNPDKFGSRPNTKATPAILDEATGEALRVIEKLLKTMQRNNKRYWFVEWHGLPAHEATWELESKIRKVSHWRELINAYRHRQRKT